MIAFPINNNTAHYLKKAQSDKHDLSGKLTLKTLPDGHKLAILNKKGGFLIETFVDTQKANRLHSHILEHILTNLQDVTSSEKLEKEGAYLEAVTGNNSAKYKLESAFEDTQIINDLIKTQFNILNNRTNISKSLEKERPIMKSEYAFLTSEKALSNSKKEEKNIQEKIIKEIFNVETLENKDNGFSENYIDKTKTEDILKVYDDCYKPQNMTTVIITDKEPQIIENEILKYTQINKLQNTNIQTPLRRADIKGKKRIDYYSKNDIDYNIKLYFKAPERTSAKDQMIMQLLTEIVNSENKILNLGICETKVLNLGDDLIILSSKAHKGEENSILTKINNKLLEISEKPINPKELETNKLKILNTFSLKNEINSFLSEDIEKAVSQDSLSLFSKREEILNDITADDIQNFVKTYLDTNNSRTLVIQNPEKLPLAYSDFSYSGIKKLSFKATMDKIDFGNFHQYKYPTNLSLTVNTDDNINRTSYYLKLDNKNKKLTDNQLEMEVLTTLISTGVSKKIDKKFAGLYKINCDKNSIEFELSHIPSQSKEIIKA